MPSTSIRTETATDEAAISSVIERAFATERFSSRTEQFIVRALRKAGTLKVSLVAEQEQRIVGHIALSPVVISDGAQGWFGLGPLAVEPILQRQGIGSALVSTGLAKLRESGAEGCVVLGEPTYYGRFGFHVLPGLVYSGAPLEYFMAQVFGGAQPKGEVSYHGAFSAEA